VENSCATRAARLAIGGWFLGFALLGWALLTDEARSAARKAPAEA